MLSCLAMQYLNFEVLFICKLLNGFLVTVVHIDSVKMINETIPVYLLDSYGLSVGVMGGVGYLLVMGLGLGLPNEDYSPGLIGNPINDAAKQADIEDQFWRVHYLVPFMVECIMLSIYLI